MKILASHQTGSSFTCDPPVQNTDLDVLYYVDSLPIFSDMTKTGWIKCESKTAKEEWSYEASQGFDEYWTSYRLGNLNAIFSTRKDFYLKFVAATLLAKHLNLLDKRERVELHRFIRDGGSYGGPFAPNTPVENIVLPEKKVLPPFQPWCPPAPAQPSSPAIPVQHLPAMIQAGGTD